jgi:hypothetical protein
MAWTTPITWSGVPTVNQFNQQIRDNLNALYLPPSVRAYRSSTQTLTTATDTTILWDSEEWDNDGMHSTSVDTGRLTIVTAGRYMLGGHLEYAAGSNTYRHARIIVNTGSLATQGTKSLPLSSGYLDASCNPFVIGRQAYSSGYYYMEGRQDSGGNLGVLQDSGMWAHWINGS